MSDSETRTGFVMDRALQRTLLEMMRARHPDSLDAASPYESDAVVGHLAYLAGHGLCDVKLMKSQTEPCDWDGASITSKGLDFLEDDGGLSAILGVVTVKLHADTVRDLVAAKVDASDMPPEQKSAIKDQLRKLPATALQASTTELVKAGLDHLPNATHWLQTLAGLA